LELFFHNVLYIPKLGQKLLSAHSILKNGYSITGNSHSFIIRSDYDQKPLLIGCSKGSLYLVPLIVKLPSTVRNRTDLIVENALPSVASTETQKVGKIPSGGTKEDESKIKPLILTLDEAHLHFGHIGKERLLQLFERLEDIMIKPDSKLSQCDVCLLTKMAHKAIKKGPAPQEKEKGAMFHADICSMPAESIGGKIAFVSFIDDDTRYRFVYLFVKRVKQVSSLRNYLRDSLTTYVSGGSGLMVVENLLVGCFRRS